MNTTMTMIWSKSHLQSVDDKIAFTIENQTSPRSSLMDIFSNILSDLDTSSCLPYSAKMKTVVRRMARLREDGKAEGG